MSKRKGRKLSGIAGAKSLAIVRSKFPGVKKIFDATEDLDVEITKSHNKRGVVKRHEECAMAVACTEENHLTGTIIARGTAYTVKGDTATRYRMSFAGARQQLVFDGGGEFEPGTYTLKAPRAYERLGEHHGPSYYKKGSNPTLFKPKHKRHVLANGRDSLLRYVS